MLVREAKLGSNRLEGRWARLALYMKKPDRCTPLEFEFWLAGKNLNPYLKGELFSLIIKRYAKLKELQLPYGPEARVMAYFSIENTRELNAVYSCVSPDTE